MIKQTILVTGAPRSGTTPLGNIMSMLPGAVELYEPMGPTGDRRFTNRFPIPGEPDFSNDDLVKFVADMQRLDLNFKPQKRPGHRGLSGFVARLFGTRSLLSYRRAKLTPGKRLLIWKDPHGVFCVPAAATAGFRSVVSIRSPEAHAASFKRLGWVSKIDEIYPRYRSAFGEIAGFEVWMKRFAGTSYGSAALLWHLIHTRIITMPNETKTRTYLLNMEKVAQDEPAAYAELFAWLGEAMPPAAKEAICKRSTTVKSNHVPQVGKVHDFNRTAAQANNYWRDILSTEEAQAVAELNGSIWSLLQL